jgi:hypothetical protein
MKNLKMGVDAREGIVLHPGISDVKSLLMMMPREF